MNQNQNFLPTSIIESSLEDIEARRVEYDEADIGDLDTQLCIFLTTQECTQNQLDILNWQKQFPDRLASEVSVPHGKLFCFDLSHAEHFSTRMEDLPHCFRAKLLVHPSDPSHPSHPVWQLPKDLHGYAFYVGALPPLPPPEKYKHKFVGDNRMILNGDGMIYRLGFKQGRATLKTRIAKTPCYYVDQAISHDLDRYIDYAFHDGGVSRTSFRVGQRLQFGSRNQLNIAFLKTRDRLLLSFDAGRPHELDPESLELLEPVGNTQQWIGILQGIGLLNPFLDYVFHPYSNPAHPVCDLSSETYPDEVLTANYSAGLRIIDKINHAANWVREKINKVDKDENLSVEELWGSFTDLIRYRFADKQLERWRLVLPDNEPVVIDQSIHQMALTEKFIIIPDIAFKVETSQIFEPFIANPIRTVDQWIEQFNQQIGIPRVDKTIGYFFTALFLRLIKPYSFTNLYIISRDDLDSCPAYHQLNEPPKSLRVMKVVLPYEVSHFTVDYANPEIAGAPAIVLHAGHSNNWDVTEWIGQYDKPVDQGNARHLPKRLNQDLLGIGVGPMDLGSLARYTINGQTGAILDAKVVADPEKTWALSVYTHRDICRDRATEAAKTVKNIYWMAWGFSRELIPDRIYDAYKNNSIRFMPAAQLPEQDKPMTLIRLDTEKMAIVDHFEFPIGSYALTPQFIPSSAPCPEGRDPSTHGYIACIVLSDTPDGKPKDEFWIFHADDFQKPIYRLSHFNNPKVNLGLTIHSIWLGAEEVEGVRQKDDYSDEQRQARRRTSFLADYARFIEHNGSDKSNPFDWNGKEMEVVRQLFQKSYEPYIQQVLEKDLPRYWRQ